MKKVDLVKEMNPSKYIEVLLDMYDGESEYNRMED